MTAKYSHLADDPIRRAADQIGDALTAAMSGRPSAEVVTLKAKSHVPGQGGKWR
jgi:hypothetical protein